MKIEIDKVSLIMLYASSDFAGKRNKETSTFFCLNAMKLHLQFGFLGAYLIYLLNNYRLWALVRSDRFSSIVLVRSTEELITISKSIWLLKAFKIWLFLCSVNIEGLVYIHTILLCVTFKFLKCFWSKSWSL